MTPALTTTITSCASCPPNAHRPLLHSVLVQVVYKGEVTDSSTEGAAKAGDAADSSSGAAAGGGNAMPTPEEIMAHQKAALTQVCFGCCIVLSASPSCASAGRRLHNSHHHHHQGVFALKLYPSLDGDDDGAENSFDMPLPFVIGTPEFMTDATIGLGVEPEEDDEDDAMQHGPPDGDDYADAPASHNGLPPHSSEAPLVYGQLRSLLLLLVLGLLIQRIFPLQLQA